MKRFTVLAIGVVVLLALGSSYCWAVAPRNGLVGEWLFEGNALDTSGNNNNGAVHGASLAPDRYGRARSAYRFDGVSSYIEVQNSDSLNVADQITMAFWMRVTEFTNNASPVIYKGGPEVDGCYQNREYAVFVSSEGILHMPSSGDDSCQVWLDSTPQNALGIWLFFTGVIDRKNHSARTYINGILNNSGPDAYSTFTANQGSLTFGSSNDLSPSISPFKGVLDDVRIYNRALSASEITALYHHKDPVISSFTATPGAGSTPLNVNFACRATSPNGPIVQYLWDVDGDGVPEFITGVGNLQYTYSADGTYNAEVRVVDSGGYWARSDSAVVTVGNGPELAGTVEYYQFNDITKRIETKVRVYNRGNVVAGPFSVIFSVSDDGLGAKSFKTLPVASLAAGQNTLLGTSYTFPESIYGRLISVAIDGGKKVDEVDETNNDLHISVGPAAN
jgi:PKD repeat protein